MQVVVGILALVLSKTEQVLNKLKHVLKESELDLNKDTTDTNMIKVS